MKKTWETAECKWSSETEETEHWNDVQ